MLKNKKSMTETLPNTEEKSISQLSKQHTFDEALSASLEYFKGDELAAKVWVSKYALKDSNGWVYELTPVDMHNRIAKELARIENKYRNPLSESEIFDLIKDFKYIIPQGSPMSGIGNNFQTISLGNCFVVGNPKGMEDSYGGIIRIDERIAQLQKRRAGVGTDISGIRPAGIAVNNAAITATGIVPFMERYSNTTREVAQGGRRGALMLSCSITHPESEDFINAKIDTTKVTGANISVKITDTFMEAVITDSKYKQQWPIDSKNPLITKEINAKDLWKKIIHNAWNSAEPGILFWDKIISESPADCYSHLGFETTSTNPCIIGSTLIAVADGRNAVSIEQLVKEEKDVPVYSTDPNTGQTQIKYGRNPRKTKSKAEVWKLTLDDNSTLIATSDHKVLLTSLEYVELKNLKKGDSIMPFYSFNSNGYRQISNIGKKMSGGRFSNRRQYREIYNFNNESIDSKKYAIHNIDFNNKNDNPLNLIKMLHEDHINLHAEKMKGKNNPYHKMTNEWKKQFASHPGEKNGMYIKVTNNELVEHGKKIFKENGKITKLLWKNYAEENKLPMRITSKFRFNSFSNFKNQVAENHKVESVEFHGYEDVYNITVDDNHNYHIITSSDDSNYITSSGICIKNCGELPLPPGDSCRLLAINLYSYVVNPFKEDSYFDFKLFKDHTRKAQRLMDDIVDLELEKIDKILNKIKSDPENIKIKANELDLWKEIREKCENGRRTGTGITGEGDMLAALNITYGTPKATEFAENIQKILAIEAYRSSCYLAKERGAFPIFDPSYEKNNPFLNRIKNEDSELAELMEKYGRRNIALLTIAPTGSVSILTKTTAGIECAFLLSYKRRRKINPNDKNIEVAYVDPNGDSWEEYLVFHNHFKTWIEASGLNYNEVSKMSDDKLNEVIKTSPYYKALSNDVDWVEKVKMQGAMQKWIDHSISVTVNLPNEVSEDLVNDVYVTAWKSGCKGCTVYRDGSRTGVLISLDKPKEPIKNEDNHAPKRPKYLDCEIIRFVNKGERWIGFMGLYEGRPYEMFTGKEEELTIPFNVKTGVIRKTKVEKEQDGETFKVSKYDFLYPDQGNIEIEVEWLNRAFNKDYWNYAKLISGVLRHKMPLPYVVDLISSLTLEDDLISTWKNGVARMIKKYIQNGTEVKYRLCKECGGESLIYQEGCLICSGCGSSKC